MKKLGLLELLAMGVGSIIGSGIFMMIGIGIGYTGRSVSLALVLGCFLNLIMCVPFFFTVGLNDLKGGTYGIAKMLLGEKIGGFYGLIHLFANLTIAIYCISVVKYLSNLVPAIAEHQMLYSILTLVCFFLITLTGIKGMVKFQGIIVAIMLVALFVFIFFGFGKVSNGYFQQPGFITNGLSGFIIATALLSFASMGANMLVNFYEVIENPRRNYPLALFLSTLLVAVIYFLIGYVASGVLPVEVASNKTLALVAKEVLPQSLYVFFVLGGAILALVSTLNNMLAFIRYPVMEIARDGYLPKWFLKVSKNEYPYYLMAVLFVFGLIPIVFGIDIEQVVSIVMGPSFLLMMIMCLRVMKIPKLFPEQWKASNLHVPTYVLNICAILAALTCTILGLGLLTNLSPILLLFTVAFGICGAIYVTIIANGKKKSAQLREVIENDIQ